MLVFLFVSLQIIKDVIKEHYTASVYVFVLGGERSSELLNACVR